MKVPSEPSVPAGTDRQQNPTASVGRRSDVVTTDRPTALRKGCTGAAERSRYVVRRPPNVRPACADYHVVVPVFNEAGLLEQVLQRIDAAGYLRRVTFVNDASTDDSAAVLDRWREDRDIDVIHLAVNRRKEGAIRAAMESLERQGRLPDKLILLDADSFMASTRPGTDIDRAVRDAAAHMDANDLAAMGFRYDIFLPDRPKLLQRAQYAEFAGLRFMNRVAPQQHQMWVINGRGGMFRTRILLPILQAIEPDFETGDILITQKIMASGHKIAYYDDIKVETMDVDTLRDFSRQRRRWARGTTRVMFTERGYYRAEIARRSKVGLMTLLYLFVDIGIPLSVITTLLITGNPIDFLVYKLPIALVVWTTISTGLALSDRGVRREGDVARVLQGSLINTIVYLGVTMPSRFAGLFDTVRRLTGSDRQRRHVDDPALRDDATADQKVLLDERGARIRLRALR